MIVIEKIEIKSFRSFGNRKVGKVVIEKLNHLNIFSGSNDSGKSNILRALNLFFNKHTDINEFFSFEIDFFKKDNYDQNDVKEEVVTIKIHFDNQNNRGKNYKYQDKIYLPEKFWVSRKFSKSSEYSSFAQDDGLIATFKQEKAEYYKNFLETADQKEIIKSTAKASLKKQLTQFIDSIQYHYVPAIKDKSYFSHLYGELQQTLWKEKTSSVLSTKESFEQSIQQTTEKLMNNFKEMTKTDGNFSPIFELPANLIDIFKSLNVNTGSVKLTLRGDGIQAKLIPEILSFISQKESSFKSRSLRTGEKAKKYFIWGFEEPENSYEYKNAQMLAEKLKEHFSQDVQILLTTHSFNFISLEGKNISTYRVFKDDNLQVTNLQIIKKDKNGKFNFEMDDAILLHDELGIFKLNKQLETLYLSLETHKKELNETVETVKNKLREYEKPLIITEGKTDWKHLKKALERFQKDGLYQQLDIDFLEYEDDIQMGDSYLDTMVEAFKKTHQSKKVIFIFDRDNESYIKKYAQNEFNDHSNNVYSFCIPKISDELDKISIEFYYLEGNLKTKDQNGRRLFLGDEFYQNGNSKCGNYQAKEQNKCKKLTIIDNKVFNKNDLEHKNSIALSKNDFTNNILDDKKEFSNFDIENFKKIFNTLEKIVL